MRNTYAMQRFHKTLAALGAAVLLALLILPGAALAHERRTIGGGKYDVVVGWDVEPAFQGQKNGASIRISQAGSNPAVPVAGAEKTLKVQLKQGASSQEFPLRAVFGQPGYYVADVMPARSGDFQFIFTGTLEGTSVNETFDTADGKFNKVEPTTAITFPQGAAVDPSQAQATAQSAQAEAQQARTFGYVGTALGALGLLAALGAWLTRPRPTTAPSASSRRAVETS